MVLLLSSLLLFIIIIWWDLGALALLRSCQGCVVTGEVRNGHHFTALLVPDFTSGNPFMLVLTPSL